VWGIFKGSHVTYRFVCDCIGGFHKHHSLDAKDNTWARILTEVGEEGSQLVYVGKCGVLLLQYGGRDRRV
jgi:hypothetical protein